MAAAGAQSCPVQSSDAMEDGADAEGESCNRGLRVR